MSKEITEEQLVRVLADINRIIHCEIARTEPTSQYPQASTDLWSKEIVQRWGKVFPRLVDMATGGNFSEVFDALHKELKPFQHDPK